jgi:hypothetical protein
LYIRDYRDFKNYKIAKLWYDAFEPTPDSDCSIVHEFALGKWEEANAARATVDSKAEGFLKFSSAGLAAIVAAIFSPAISGAYLWLMQTALGLAAISAALAAFARRRVIWPSPMETSDALEYASQDLNSQQAVIAASLHVATIGTAEHVAQKAKIVDLSVICIVLAIVALVASVFFASQDRQVTPASPHSIHAKAP